MHAPILTLALTILTLSAANTGPALGQSLDGTVGSGLTGNVASGLTGGVPSGLDGGLGSRQQGRTRALTDTAGSAGGGNARGFLLGQPSNFGPSVQATGPLGGLSVDTGLGPAMPLSMGNGPAGPLD